MEAHLPFFRGQITGVPAVLAGLVATADLQGRIGLGGHPTTLLGWEVAAQLPQIHTAAGLPEPALCAALLAGDFYTVPNAIKMGGTGDVSEVWSAMKRQFAHVAGVLGNHDILGDAAWLEKASSKKGFQGRGSRQSSDTESKRFTRSTTPHSESLTISTTAKSPPKECLDGQVVEYDGVRIGGVSGIVSESRGTNRRVPEEFAEVLLGVLMKMPHIVVLHDPPQSDEGARGSPAIATTLKSVDFSGLVVCGHSYWRPRVQRCGKATILNVDGAVVTLTPGSPGL